MPRLKKKKIGDVQIRQTTLYSAVPVIDSMSNWFLEAWNCFKVTRTHIHTTRFKIRVRDNQMPKLHLSDIRMDPVQLKQCSSLPECVSSSPGTLMTRSWATKYSSTA